MGEPAGLASACRELVEAVGLRTGFLYLQVTRGVAPRTHLPPPGMKPTVFILPALFDFQVPAGRPMRAVSERDYRWRKCDIKSTSLIATVLGKVSAETRGADEILFVDDAGAVREGGQTNFFVRRDDTLETHPADHRILPGVTRQLLLGLAGRQGLPVTETPPRLSQRAEWQEAFICGTLTGVQPVVELDGETIAGGTVGEWTRRLAEANERYELEWIAAAVRPVATPIEG
jgi:D-alanine transaminase